MKITVFGFGFVGKAVCAGFTKLGNTVTAVDPFYDLTLKDAFAGGEPDVVFVCVPTPMGKDGVVDITNVLSVFDDLYNYNGLIVLKSTVTPSEIIKLESINNRFVYNPEFLTEANANRDFLNPFMHVFGGNKPECEYLEYIYENFSNCSYTDNIHYVSRIEASMIKYGVNSFLATKVMFMNQFAAMCDRIGANYDAVAAGIGTDPRITRSHMMVPGPDGRKGTAGACFAKDIPAIIKESILWGTKLNILNTVWNDNCDIRNSYPVPLDREIAQNITFDKI